MYYQYILTYGVNRVYLCPENLSELGGLFELSVPELNDLFNNMHLNGFFFSDVKGPNRWRVKPLGQLHKKTVESRRRFLEQYLQVTILLFSYVTFVDRFLEQDLILMT